MDDGTNNEGDTNSELSEDSLTVLCSDGKLDRLEATIKDDDCSLSLLTPKERENAPDEGDPNTNLSDDTSTVLCSEVLLDTTMEDGDTMTVLLT